MPEGVEQGRGAAKERAAKRAIGAVMPEGVEQAYEKELERVLLLSDRRRDAGRR